MLLNANPQHYQSHDVSHGIRKAHFFFLLVRIFLSFLFCFSTNKQKNLADWDRMSVLTRSRHQLIFILELRLSQVQNEKEKEEGKKDQRKNENLCAARIIFVEHFFTRKEEEKKLRTKYNVKDIKLNQPNQYQWLEARHVNVTFCCDVTHFRDRKTTNPDADNGQKYQIVCNREIHAVLDSNVFWGFHRQHGHRSLTWNNATPSAWAVCVCVRWPVTQLLFVIINAKDHRESYHILTWLGCASDIVFLPVGPGWVCVRYTSSTSPSIKNGMLLRAVCLFLQFTTLFFFFFSSIFFFCQPFRFACVYIIIWLWLWHGPCHAITFAANHFRVCVLCAVCSLVDRSIHPFRMMLSDRINTRIGFWSSGLLYFIFPRLYFCFIMQSTFNYGGGGRTFLLLLRRRHRWFLSMADEPVALDATVFVFGYWWSWDSKLWCDSARWISLKRRNKKNNITR